MSKSLTEKINQTLTFIKDFQINNSTLNDTVHEVKSFFNLLLDNVSNSFFTLVNVFKQKLITSNQHAKELILNAKKQAQEQLIAIQKKINDA